MHDALIHATPGSATIVEYPSLEEELPDPGDAWNRSLSGIRNAREEGMSVQLQENIAPHTLNVRITGKLSRNDFDQFLPRLEELMKTEDHLNMLVELKDFYGWDAGGFWEELKFDAKHRNDIDRIAMVGESTWQKWMTDFCKPFTTAKVKFFDRPELTEARRWVAEKETANPIVPGAEPLNN